MKAAAKIVEVPSVPVTIKPVNMQRIVLPIIGVAPYVQHKFSQKAKEQIMATQMAGTQAKSKRVREPKDFDAVYEGATHRDSNGGYGIPAPAFRNAMISACRAVGFKMTHAKLGVFIEPDSFDVEDGTPLVKINGEPTRHTAPARNDNGGVDIRVRPMWREGWRADVKITFDGDMFSSSDVVNLMRRAGLQVGIGEGRPDSKMSAGLGWGLFDLGGEAK